MYDTFIQYTTSDLAMLMRDLNRDLAKKEELEEEEAITAALQGGVAHGRPTDAVLFAEKVAQEREQAEEVSEETTCASQQQSRLAIRQCKQGV